MASWIVHLRIADKLLSQLDRIDMTAFVVGNMAPDSGVPNADWSAFHPPKSVSHFERKTAAGTSFDIDAFRGRYFSNEAISGYDLESYSFFLGYYVHLLTDIRWSETVYASLKSEHAEAYASDKRKLVEAAKEDWYDLDFLYLEQHPEFCAFSIYEKAVGFRNRFLDLFSEDAFENRREYICGFYHGEEHGQLHREYPYLTPAGADLFVEETSAWLLDQIRDKRQETGENTWDNSLKSQH